VVKPLAQLTRVVPYAINGRKNVLARLLGLLCVIIFAVNPLTAQIDSGGITGTVRDTSGAVVSGASITLTNDAMNSTAVTQSTSTGTYVFDGVKAGSYTLKAEAGGFQIGVSMVSLMHS